MSSAAARIASEMGAGPEDKLEAAALEREKQDLRLKEKARQEVELWDPGQPGKWSDQQYQDICAGLPRFPPPRKVKYV